MKVTGDLQLVKRMNKSIILDKIRNAGPISRAAISAETGLNKGTVSNLVSELIEEQLIMETGTGASSGGRKPVMLLFRAGAGFAIGIDLGVNYLRAALTDLEGRIVEELLHPLADTSLHLITQLICESVSELQRRLPASPYGIIGVGIGVPGMVDGSGSVISAPNLGWRDVELRAALQAAIPLPVWIDNEANAGALGEKRFGAGQAYAHFIYVSAGIGIGAGIILNDALFRGSGGLSGEMGHMTIETNGRQCRCGNAGCWEMYASENALLHAAQQSGLLAPDEAGDIGLDRMTKLAASGDPEAIRLFADIGTMLGIGIAGIMNSFNPQAVVVGNRLLLAKPWIAAPLKQAVEQRGLRSHLRQTDIVFAELGLRSAALGAASLAIEQFLQNDHAARGAGEEPSRT
ncbi:ROK family transcriptional regulator [Xylanibacillus composti]|uniref:Xylose repressor n=1 Tax=Xylanibacillus composti TaxID=1572762 RepID=A0A8J4GZI7_9BACL|nr:ROK family transcriptional regulator [Xylanibacillus composti]MDT9726247.1 ROK family transcriptional regulator [Xylanibacillus composti]GIQ68098.1 xylose repressor [Xylanibacillus composti]